MSDVLSTETTLKRLREIQNCKIGGPIPEWMVESKGWGEPLSRLAGDAADLIEWYRSGKMPPQMRSECVEYHKMFKDKDDLYQ